ncbi:MAG: hypothetical protein ABF449_09755 [Ethanoligenens sp.]
MSESVGAVQLDVKLNNASLDSEIKEAGSKSGSTFSSIFSASSSSGISGALSTVKSAVLGLGATIASGGGLFALADSAVNAGNSVYELAQKMHLPTDQAALLNRELSLSNTDSGSFISTMTRLDKGLESAGSKGNTTTAALKAFGVTLTDGHGQLLPMNQQLANLAAAYQNAAANGNDEAFVAQVLGNRGVALTGILEDYNDVAAQAGKTKGIGIDPKEAHQVALEIQTVKSQVSILGTTIGSAVLPIVMQAFPPIQSALANIATTIKNHQGQIQSFARIIGGVIVTITQGVAGILNFIAGHGSLAITVIGGIVAVMGAWKAITLAANIVGAVQNTIMAVDAARKAGVTAATIALVAAKKTDAGAQIGLNAALLACPLTWIIIGIVALVAVFVLLWTKCAWFRDFWIGLWNGIVAVFNTVKNAIGTAINAVVGFFQKWGVLILAAVLPVIGIPLLIIQHWGQISAFFVGLWNGIKAGMSAAWNAIKMVVMAVVTPLVQGVINIWNNMKGGIQTIMTGLQNILGGIWTVIKNVILGPVLLICDLVTGNFTKLHNDAIQIVTNIQNGLAQIWAGIQQVFTGALQAISGLVTTVWNGITSVTSTVWNAITSFLSGLWNGIVNTAQNIWNGLISFFSNLPQNIYNIMVDVGNWIRNAWDTIISFVQGIPGKFASGLSGLGSAVRGAFQDAISFITNLPGEALKWGGDIINGIVSGIKNAASAVGQAVQGVAQDIRAFLHFSEPDVGPLVGFHTWPKDMMTGMAQDILDNKSAVTGALQNVTSGMAVALHTNVATAGMGMRAQTITTNNTKSPVINVNGPVNVADQGNKKQTLQQLQFLAAI